MAKWSHNKLVIAEIGAMDPVELYSELLGMCLEKRYKFGWAYHKFLEFKGENGEKELPRPRPAPKAPSLRLREVAGIMKNRWKQKKNRERLKRDDHSLIANESNPALED